jgi:hypothetical protein
MNMKVGVCTAFCVLLWAVMWLSASFLPFVWLDIILNIKSKFGLYLMLKIVQMRKYKMTTQVDVVKMSDTVSRLWFMYIQGMQVCSSYVTEMYNYISFLSCRKGNNS